MTAYKINDKIHRNSSTSSSLNKYLMENFDDIECTEFLEEVELSQYKVLMIDLSQFLFSFCFSSFW